MNLINMTKCKRLQHLPMGMSYLTSLVKLMLSGCSELESIQDFPRNLKELYLAGTPIKEVSSSLCDLTELLVLDAGNCKRLENLPIGIGNLNSLVMLTLSGCSGLEEIHDLPRNLQILNLAETPISKMPSSFEDLTELIALDLNHCVKLQHLRMGFSRSAVRIELSGCSELEYIMGFSLQNMVLLHIDGTNKVMLHGPPPCKVIFIWENWRRFQLLPREMTDSKFILTLMPSVTTPYGSKLPFSISSSLVSSMYVVVSMFLSNTIILDICIPQEICHFPSLKTLDLGGSGFRKLPESLKQIPNLKSLILCHCPNLESLPELPQSLELLNAHSCLSLKNIHCSFEQFPRDYTFYNCFNLSPNLVTDFLEKALDTVAHMARENLQKLIKAPVFYFSVPASVSLKTIFHLRRGSFANIRLTTRIETLLGFRLSVVVSFMDNFYKDAGFSIRCVCRWENMKGISCRLERIFDCSNLGEVAPKVRKDHMFIFCDVSMHPGGAAGSDLDILDDIVLFEFLPVNRHNRLLDDCCMITKCGVDVIAAATKVTIMDSQPTTCVSDEAISDNLIEIRRGGISLLEGEKPETATPFGLEHRIKQVEEKLDLASWDETRIVGIVGMPGIGKTTLATELFNKYKYKFCRCVNFLKIREKWTVFGADRVRKMFLEELLQIKIISDDEATHERLESNLLCNKVFVVLDDVSSKRQIEVLLGNLNWIKEGSRIVITTRDRTLITELDPNPYVVPRLNLGDGLMYFSFYAFEDHVCNPRMGDYMKMSREFVDYARRNPLALRLLGSDLLRKGEAQWRKQLDTLAKRPNKIIQILLKVSYDELSEEEKDMFLDIACFFRSEDEFYVRSLLDSGDSESFQAAREITDLSHKFFISISGGRIEMHDLLHAFAMDLCSLASCGVNQKKSRLWNGNYIIAALRGKMETKTVRGISLDVSEVTNMFLERSVFTNMCNLRYLKLYSSTCPLECEGECKLKFPDGLSFPLEEVRYLDWLKFPLEELPSDFIPKNLVDLRLPYSKIKQVWKVSKDTPKLKWVDLNNSRMLQTLSGFSNAPNLLRLNLECCSSLVCLSEEMGTMESLVFLNLRGCTSLRHLPDINLSSLRTLILSGCSNLQEFRLISKNIENLYLDGTAIEDLPSDIVKLQRLILLNLKECRRLGSLPECIGKLKALKELILSGCSNLKSFPNVEENMENFRVLLLDRTSIEEVPKILRGNNSLSFLRRLSLSRNDVISSLGSDISQLYHLKWLDLKYCKKLRCLSTLPPNLQCLDAHGCISLETVTSPLAFLMPMEDIHSMFIFTNCCKLNDAAKNDIASHIRRKC